MFYVDMNLLFNINNIYLVIHIVPLMKEENLDEPEYPFHGKENDYIIEG